LLFFTTWRNVDTLPIINNNNNNNNNNTQRKKENKNLQLESIILSILNIYRNIETKNENFVEEKKVFKLFFEVS
jgi:DNA-binding transcriptional regulator GbsR (MarR family)